MFREAPIARCLRLAFSGGVAGLAFIGMPAFAQTSTDAAPQKVERVEITGTSIKRIEGETGLPVQVITRQDIAKTGATNAEDLLRMISAASGTGSIQVSSAAGATTSSVSTVSVRGLGGPRTLILIDGRRTSTYGGAPGGGGDTAVDVNSIPLAAIERIEVLKDGASAVYGSDAIAGVINFILRKDYVGGEVTIGYGDSTQGGATDKKINAIVGFGDLQSQGFNVTIAAGDEKQDPLFGGQRKFANSSISATGGVDTTSGNTFPATVAFGPGFGNAATPGYPNCKPSVIDPNEGGAPVCRFDPASLVALVPDSERQNVLVNGRLKIGSESEAYFQGFYTNNVVKTSIQPVPLSDEFALPSTNPYNAFLTNLINTQYGGNPALLGLVGFSTILLPPSSPYYPTAFAAANGISGQPLDIRYRDFASGPRRLEDDSQNTRLLLGFKTNVVGWDADFAFLHVESDVQEKVLGGFPIQSKLLPLIDSGVINPFGATASASAVAQAASDGFTGQAFNSKTQLTSIDAKGSRDVFQLPAGTVSMALGAEYRQEKYDFESSSEIQTGDVSGYGGNFLPVSAQRHVGAAFAEVVVPILKNFEANIAARYDNYEGVGDTVNPKLSLRWQPTETLLLRGSVGTGFRAPALTDLFSPQTQSVTVAGLNDPLRCPFTGDLVHDCLTQFKTLTGGNTKLTPEKSTSSTLGFVFEPVPGLSIAADLFDIQLRNTIALGGLDPGTVLLASAQSAQQFSQFIIRGPLDCTTVPGTCLPGRITQILQQNTNLDRVHLQGFDLDAKWRVLDMGGNKVTLNFSGTYYNKFDVQNLDGSYTGAINTATGAFIAGGVLTRWKHQAALTWDSGPYSATLTEEFQSQYNDIAGNVTGAPRTVGTYEIWDVQGTYTGVKNLSLTIGVRNLFDRDPPYANAAINGQFQSGYDISYANPIGRFVYGTVTYKFF